MNVKKEGRTEKCTQGREKVKMKDDELLLQKKG
jgi:hypothetical protein